MLTYAIVWTAKMSRLDQLMVKPQAHDGKRGHCTKKCETVEEQPPAKVAKVTPPSAPLPALTINEPTSEPIRKKEPKVQGKGKGVMVVHPKKQRAVRKKTPPQVPRDDFQSEHFIKLVMPYNVGASGSTLGRDMLSRLARFINKSYPSQWDEI